MIAAEITDPKNARAILFAAIGLLVLAGLMGAATVWWWRRTKAEHPALGPLSTMGEPRWKTADADERRRILDSMRPSEDSPDVVGVDSAERDAAEPDSTEPEPVAAE